MNLLGKWIVPGTLALLLSACGGGGGGGGANVPPTAAFAATPANGQAPLTVAFDAAASSDPDGSITGYAWTFGDGATGSGPTTSHTYQAAGGYTATLTVTDNRGATGQTTREITVTSGPAPQVTVSGRITFSRVPFAAPLGSGLDFANARSAPAREVTVEVLPAGGTVPLATTATDANGNYALRAPANSNVFVRARAESRWTATPARPASWDLQVRDNYAGRNSLYAIDGATFNTGTGDHTRNLHADDGWDGFAGYAGPRAAAPFAILDTLYSAVQFVVSRGDASLTLGPLDAYWSTENRPCDDCGFDPATGEIPSTGYVPSFVSSIPSGIYVLGAADLDTDEFDQHVIAHEFQHYLEDEVSRSDTIGGPHGPGELLDMRVAFSEGYGNAFSAMVLNNPVYRDSYGPAQGADFSFDFESQPTSPSGWFSEASVETIVWDLFDAANDAGDTVSIGFGPMFSVQRAELRDGVPLGSLFPFITALKQRSGVPAAAVDARVEREGIVSATMDAYATTETHSGVTLASRDVVLPIYSSVVLGGPVARLCTDTTLDTPAGTVVGDYNKLGNRRILRFNVPSTRSVRVRVTCNATDPDCGGALVPDPDFVISRASDRYYGDDAAQRVEDHVVDGVPAGDYVLEIYEWSHIDPQATTRRGRTCMSVTITG